MLKASLQNCNLVAFNAVSLHSSFEQLLRYIALELKFQILNRDKVKIFDLQRNDQN